jgi:hypothetical protein
MTRPRRSKDAASPPLAQRIGRSVRSLGASVGSVIAGLFDSVSPPPPSPPPEPPRTPERSSSRRSGRRSRRRGVSGSAAAVGPAAATMAARYDAIVVEMLDAHGVRVRRWRKGTTGVAWESRRGGRRERWIEAPYPRGPVSCAVFLHEVAHHAIGLGAVSPRCLEEHAAWAWAIERMRERGIEPGISVERRMHAALHYALAKAIRRGLRRVPPQLEAYRRPLPERRP